jgi:hypothetical protein
MTTLQFPSLERRLLHTLTNEVTSSVKDWPPQSFEVCLKLLRQLKESISVSRRNMVDVLADGIETRTLISFISMRLPVIDETISDIHLMVRALAIIDSPDEIKALVEEARDLEKEAQRFRDFLAKVFSDASQPSEPVDWVRVEAAGQEYKSGKMKRFC